MLFLEKFFILYLVDGKTESNNFQVFYSLFQFNFSASEREKMNKMGQRAQMKGLWGNHLESLCLKVARLASSLRMVGLSSSTANSLWGFTYLQKESF